MKQFDICLQTFEDVQDFVELATVQPFRILVGNDRIRVNAKSFMGMFSLDYSRPLCVKMHCTEEEFLRFQQAAEPFLA